MSAQTITRADLADAVFDDLAESAPDLKRHESADLVETVLDLVSDALVDGQVVKLASFGVFSTRDKSERMGRNPKTGAEVPIAPRRVLVFKPSPVLKERVDEALSK